MDFVVDGFLCSPLLSMLSSTLPSLVLTVVFTCLWCFLHSTHHSCLHRCSFLLCRPAVGKIEKLSCCKTGPDDKDVQLEPPDWTSRSSMSFLCIIVFKKTGEMKTRSTTASIWMKCESTGSRDGPAGNLTLIYRPSIFLTTPQTHQCICWGTSAERQSVVDSDMIDLFIELSQ